MRGSDDIPTRHSNFGRRMIEFSLDRDATLRAFVPSCDPRFLERLDEEEFERLFDEEEAKVEAIRAQLDAVIERDEWPRELYFGEI